MNYRDAERAGLRYTGMSFRKWDTKNKEYYKNKVSELRKMYKVRAVLVDDRDSGWQSYYGDAAFCKVENNSVEKVQARIDAMPKQYAALKEKYEADLANAKKHEEDLRKELEEIRALLK